MASHPGITVRDLLPPAPNACHVAWLVLYVVSTLALTYGAYVGAPMDAWALCLMGYAFLVGMGCFAYYLLTSDPHGCGDQYMLPR